MSEVEAHGTSAVRSAPLGELRMRGGPQGQPMLLAASAAVAAAIKSPRERPSARAAYGTHDGCRHRDPHPQNPQGLRP
jgi:hypothetical protein